jgi:hypothetical protein
MFKIESVLFVARNRRGHQAKVQNPKKFLKKMERRKKREIDI